MAVTHDDVQHVAALARLAVAPDRLDHLVDELNGILAHMDVLSQVDTSGTEEAGTALAECTPLRADAGDPLPMHATRESFAPEIRDGLFLVPRLSSHDDGADRSP